MRKFIIIFCLLFILFNNQIFSESVLINGVDETLVFKVLGEVETESYVASLYYDDERLLDDITILDENNGRFNIAQEGRTKVFRIVIEGNQDFSRNLEVKIRGQKFVGYPRTRTANVDTQLYVNAINPDLPNSLISNDNVPFSSYISIPKGKHSYTDNIIEVRFVLAWKGNDTLLSGLYYSDIDIEYSVVD